MAANGMGTISGRMGRSCVVPAVISTTSEKSAPKKAISRSSTYVSRR